MTMKAFKNSMNRLENNLNSISELNEIISSQDINTDLILMMCGKFLGAGVFRRVYEYNICPGKYVIKLEHGNTGCNYREYDVWHGVSQLSGTNSWIKDIFAPVHYISPNGKVLIMSKTSIFPYKMTNLIRPNKVPIFLSDINPDNWGWIGNKWVCHDYACIRMSNANTKARKIDWSYLF